MKFIKVILFVVLLAVLITFAAQNDGNFASISYFGLESASMPLYALLFLAAGVMVILMSFVGLTERLRLKGQIRKLNKQVKELTSELSLYKSAPDKDDRTTKKTAAIPAPTAEAPEEKKKRRFSFKKDEKTETAVPVPEAADTAETTKVDTGDTEQ
ncbi:MAG: LapA family protein [Deltaproteobacteria bacterium]|nr:LapA family protein [Candidatus Zymogenaceae bacterium]